MGKKKECRPPIQEISDAKPLLSMSADTSHRAALTDVIMSNVNLRPE